MRIFLTLATSLSLVACGGSKPTSSEPPSADTTNESLGDTGSAPRDGEASMMSPDECEAQGGTVVGDIGDGSVACEDGWTQLGNVSGGIEEQLCCADTGDQGME